MIVVVDCFFNFRVCIMILFAISDVIKIGVFYCYFSPEHAMDVFKVIPAICFGYQVTFCLQYCSSIAKISGWGLEATQASLK